MAKCIPPEEKTIEVFRRLSAEMADSFAETFRSELAIGGINPPNAFRTMVSFYYAHIFDAIGAVLKTDDADKIKLYAEGLIKGLASVIEEQPEVVS